MMGRKSLRSRKAKSEPEHTADRNPLGLERIVFFSDAVFAIAITLLALEIRMPALEMPLDDNQLFTQFTGMWQNYLAYFISFLVIGTFWMAHHRKYQFIKRFDRGQQNYPGC